MKKVVEEAERRERSDGKAKRCKPRRGTRRIRMTQWSTRRLGTQLKVSHMMVARVWAKHGLKPQRLDRYMAANDPDFEQKAPDIIGLYLNLPAHAAVFCVDEDGDSGTRPQGSGVTTRAGTSQKRIQMVLPVRVIHMRMVLHTCCSD